MKYQLIPLLIFFASMCFPLIVILWIRYQRKERRTPLTVQLLRSPGESLSRQVENISEELDFYFTFFTITPLLCFSSYLSMRYLGNQKVSWVALLIPCVVFMAYFSFKFSFFDEERNSLRLGLDCERAVGQELNQLMLDGYRIYHDFPAENFNIDHVVIGAEWGFCC